jgi:hypothetical protein
MKIEWPGGRWQSFAGIGSADLIHEYRHAA